MDHRDLDDEIERFNRLRIREAEAWTMMVGVARSHDMEDEAIKALCPPPLDDGSLVEILRIGKQDGRGAFDALPPDVKVAVRTAGELADARVDRERKLIYRLGKLGASNDAIAERLAVDRKTVEVNRWLITRVEKFIEHLKTSGASEKDIRKAKSLLDGYPL